MRKLLLGLATLVVAGALGWLLLLTAAFATDDSPHSTVAERVWRYLAGEPGATQDVNDAADILAQANSCRELEAVADRIIREHIVAATLPHAEFDVGRQIPIKYLPKRFHHLGGSWRESPQVILRLGEDSKATQVRFHWGHGRHAIVIFVDPPSEPPKGFYVRGVSPRTYILANES